MLKGNQGNGQGRFLPGFKRRSAGSGIDFQALTPFDEYEITGRTSMTVDDSFPPVDPIVPTPAPHIVVPRQRRFSDRTRRLINELRQEQTELTEKKKKGSSGKAASNRPSPPPAPNPGTGFDKLA
jgi:hypothetical protein